MSGEVESVSPASVERAFVRFAEEMVREGFVADFSVETQDLVRLKLRRSDDDAPVTLSMTGSGEVFLLNLADAYDTQRAAYDDPDKWDALKELLLIAKGFLSGEYEEELHERRGKVIGRLIRFPEPTDTSLSTPRGLRGLFQRLVGYETKSTHSR
ncbi:hypothetical protein [Micromonospora sicca]|uniref:hypothetical protein n=1 Tax=Micromonospora sicca TaxID=2202420 RepID=UPI0011B5C426|nr:hypothetical protein [Micromonospora sp. 4G51]